MIEKEYKPFDRFLAVRRVKAVSPQIKKQSVLCDIGCGQRAFFLDRIKGILSKGYGVDASVSDIQQGNLEFINAKIEDTLPFKENDMFDHVTMLAFIEHIEKYEEILGETYRILKPGGTLIMTYPSEQSDIVLNMLIKMKIISEDLGALEHQYHFNNKSLTEVLIRLGFKQVICKKFQLGFNNLVVAYK